MPESITDAHLHLWDLSGGGYRWLAGAPEPLRRDARWQEAAPQLAALGVERVVLVQADDTPEDTRAMQEAADRIESAGAAGAESGTVRRVDVVAWLPLADPDRCAERLADADAMRHVVGVRHLVHDDPDPAFLDRSAVHESLALLAARGVPLDVPDAFPRHMDQAARVVAEVDGLVLVLDHLGKPPLGDVTAMTKWARLLRAVAKHPRAVAKLSGLATSGDGVTHREDLHRAVDLALEVFGPQRLMFGSDWPISPMPFNLHSGTGVLLELLEELTDADRAQIMRGTAERVYRRLVD